MIIEELYIISPKIKKIVSLFVWIIVILVAFLLTIIANITDSNNSLFTIIPGFAFIMPFIIDLKKIRSGLNNYILNIYCHIRKRKIASYNNTVSYNTSQKKVYTLFHKNGVPFLYLYGLKNYGKTSTIYYVLEGIYINKKSSIRRKERVLLFDCSYNSECIFDYFSELTQEEQDKICNSIIIFDNAEKLGSLFFNNYSHILSNDNITLILVDNNEKFIIDNMKDITKIKFDEAIDANRVKVPLLDSIKSFTEKEKKILFLYLVKLLNSKYVNLNTISIVLKYKESEVRTLFKRISKTGYISFLAVDMKYILCNDMNLTYVLIEKFLSNNCFKEVLNANCLLNNLDNEERWICVVLLNVYNNMELSKQDEHSLFQKAISKGKYEQLNDILLRVIEIFPSMEKKYLFEKAFLSFNLGEHMIAQSSYNRYLELITNKEEKILAKLGIIESMHGSEDEDTRKTIQTYIKEIKKGNSIYAIIARYWDYHIQIECGYFNYDNMKNIRQILISKSDTLYTNAIVLETIKRTFTDEFRCNYLVCIENEKKSEEEFKNHLKKYSNEKEGYYSLVYLDCPKNHYFALPNNNFESCIDKQRYNDADFAYRKALDYPVTDLKSKRILKLKHIDLLLSSVYLNDTNQEKFKEMEKLINVFISQSNKNKVTVHEAFGYTLMAKLYLVYRKEKEDIEFFLKKAIYLYSKYNNSYGVLRVEILLLLSKGLMNMKIENLSILIKKSVDYPREKALLQYVESCRKENKVSMLIYHDIIKKYPIIMQ